MILLFRLPFLLIRSISKMERVRMESVLREAEDIKAESRQRLATIDALKTENASIEGYSFVLLLILCLKFHLDSAEGGASAEPAAMQRP